MKPIKAIATASLLAMAAVAIAAEGSRPGPPGRGASAPTITSICATQGSTLGGDTVNITGTGLNAATAIAIDGVLVGTGWWINNDTSLTLVTPAAAHGAGTFHIQVRDSDNVSAATSNDQFTYVAPGNAPTVTSITPNNGTLTAGDYASVIGTNLSNATSISFGANSASGGNIIANSNGLNVQVKVPAGSAGTVNVTATNPSGTSPTNCAAQFTYWTSPPTSVATLPPTATRPFYNRGQGYFVKGRGIYDPNGNLFLIRGGNRLQYDHTSDNRFYSMENAERMEPYMVTTTWAVQHGLLDDALNNWVVPIVGVFHNPTFSTSLTVNAATATGNVLSFASVPTYKNGGVLVGATVVDNTTGTVIPAGTVVTATTATTVTLSNNVTGAGVGATDSIGFNATQTAGHTDQAQILGATQQWVDNCCTGVGNVGNYLSYDSKIIIGLINEYGPQAGTANPTPATWAGYLITAIQTLRATGYTAPIMIDASGGGNSPDMVIAYGPQIVASDPLHSVLFDPHMYGSWFETSGSPICGAPGCGQWLWPNTAYHLATQTFPVIIGEFGCANCQANAGTAPVTTANVMQTQVQYQSGYLAWGWDDNFGGYYCSGVSSNCLQLLGQVADSDYCYFNLSGTKIASQFGIDVVETATYGTRAAATPSTVFTGTRPSVPACSGN